MKWFLISLLLFLSGCSSLPKTMQGNSYSSLNLAAVKTNIARYKNSSFRWGGTIISVINEKDSSQIQILFHPLSSSGRPLTDKKTEGRFAITSPLFLDPAIYKQGMSITVTGVLSGEVKQQIGEKTLTIPLLSMENIHIWKKSQLENDRFYPYSYPICYPPYFYHRFNSFYNYY